MDAHQLIERQRPAGLIARIQMPNMPSLPNRRTRRNTACAILFVWLFALASGVANACLLEPHSVHDHGSPLSHLFASGTTLGLAGDHAQGLAHDDGDSDSDPGPGPAKESCLKACDEGSQSLLKHAYSIDFADPGLAPLVATAWAAKVHLSRASGRPHDFRLPERGPPIRVLLSRLAL